MEHILFCYGNEKGISWCIQTGSSTVEQKRNHPDIYLDKISREQSKYIALHVGIFWGIGTFIIKNKDTIDVKLDSKSMYEHLKNNTQISDKFIEERTTFLNKLIEQRKLNVTYILINPKENPLTKLL